MEPLNERQDLIGDEPIRRAEDQMVDAALRELAGRGPRSDLAGRIREEIDGGPSVEGSRAGGRWLVAAVLLIGVGVVALIAARELGWWGRPTQVAATGPDTPDEPGSQDPESRDPAPPQDPQPQDPSRPLGDEEKKAIEARIAELADPATRDPAFAALEALGGRANEPLIAALERAIDAKNDVLAVQIQRVLRPTHPYALAKRRLGFALDEPLILVADYSENAILVFDRNGNERWARRDVPGAWDAELTWMGTMLITEFSISRVSEIDPRRGELVWSFTDVQNPYDADRLPNGNTLITDTFGGRVIEVDPKGKVVWSYAQDVRPFDADRLANGNTLIADVIQDRVLEVDPTGALVWDAKNLVNVHDVDRLANGHTLVVLRTLNKLVEIDGDGKVVLEIKDLWSPSDADRLADGSTATAENGMVRMFDAEGQELWKKEATWVVEVNVY